MQRVRYQQKFVLLIAIEWLLPIFFGVASIFAQGTITTPVNKQKVFSINQLTIALPTPEQKPDVSGH